MKNIFLAYSNLLDDYLRRFLMLIMLSPLLSRVGYGIEWRNLIVMMWGKLRHYE